MLLLQGDKDLGNSLHIESKGLFENENKHYGEKTNEKQIFYTVVKQPN